MCLYVFDVFRSADCWCYFRSSLAGWIILNRCGQSWMVMDTCFHCTLHRQQMCRSCVDKRMNMREHASKYCFESEDHGMSSRYDVFDCLQVTCSETRIQIIQLIKCRGVWGQHHKLDRYFVHSDPRILARHKERLSYSPACTMGICPHKDFVFLWLPATQKFNDVIVKLLFH